MVIELSTPTPPNLAQSLQALRSWQSDDAPFQLHPGDVGWFWRFGADATAAALRVWTRDGQVAAVGFLDGADILRLTIAPDDAQDEELARHIAEDLNDPARGVLPPGAVSIEAPMGVRVREVLETTGWTTGEAWTPLQLSLSEPVDPGIRIEQVGAELASRRAEVQRAVFDNSRFTPELWQTMASGPFFADARDLLAFDADGNAVAFVTVWSAGEGRPGLIEPMGAHPDYRGRGHGRAITLAAAAAFRELGASTALVCTPSANVGGIAAYRAAGFQPLAERTDLARAS